VLVGPNGKPLQKVEDGPSGKSITIHEEIKEGRPVWGVEFKPGIQAFEFEEVFQILGDVIRGIAQNARSRKHEAMAMQEVAAKVHHIDKQEKK
jgi:hypothetical protein